MPIQDPFSSAKYIVLVNILQKLISFGLTQCLLRITSPDIFGRAAVQLELFLSTLLFLSREGIRLSLLREHITANESAAQDNELKLQQFINTSWFPTIILSIIILLGTIFSPTSNDKLLYVLYGFGAIIEAMGEPWVNINMNAGNLSPKLKAETFAVMVKSVSIIVLVGYWNFDIIGFGIAQVLYGIVYFVSLISISSISILPWPRIAMGKDIVSKQTSWLVFMLTGSAILKHALTESDKIALSFFSSSYDQGIYAVANNYGSLAARLLFLPLEDTSRIAFSRLSDQSDDQDSRKKAAESLQNLVVKLIYLVTFVGSIFVIFGIPYVSCFVRYGMGKQWQNIEMITTLQLFCIYLLLLGINGVTEAFVHSLALSSNISFVNMIFVISSMFFIVTVYSSITTLGTKAVVIANCLSMTTRIFGSGVFIYRYFNKENLSKKLIEGIFPSWKIVLLAVVIFSVNLWSMVKYDSSDKSLKDSLFHVIFGTISGILYLIGLFNIIPRAIRDDIVASSRQILRKPKQEKEKQT